MVARTTDRSVDRAVDIVRKWARAHEPDVATKVLFTAHPEQNHRQLRVSNGPPDRQFVERQT